MTLYTHAPLLLQHRTEGEQVTTLLGYPLKMNSSSCDICRLNDLLRSLRISCSLGSISVLEESQRAVTKSGNIPDCSAEEGSLLAFVCVCTIFLQYIFLTLISVSCNRLNLPLTITNIYFLHRKFHLKTSSSVQVKHYQPHSLFTAEILQNN